MMTNTEVTACRPKAQFPSKRNRLRCVRCVWMETGLKGTRYAMPINHNLPIKSHEGKHIQHSP